jgi:hypothetical protein
MSARKKATSEAVMYRKSFHDLLEDAAWFTVHSADEATEKKPWGSPRFTGIAILCCGLVIECVSNCCIRILRMEPESEAELELAKTFVKYDAFLLAVTRGKKHVPRKHELTRKIASLLSIRNSFVHPKITSVSFTQKGHKLDLNKSKLWPYVDIPRDRKQWLPLHAYRAFVAMSDFLNFYFFDLCGFDATDINDRQTVARIFHSEIEFAASLSSGIKAGDRRQVVPANPTIEVMTLIKKFDLDCGFLGYFTHDGKGKALLPKRKLGSPVID